MSIDTINLAKLRPAPENVRSTPSATSIEALAASIKTQGLLQNLVAYPDKSGAFHYVVAGCRRLAALNLLNERGQLPKHYVVPVKVVAKADTISAGLSENTQREAMNPADEFSAYQALADDHWSIDKIADAFGCSILQVERRLALAAAAPELLDEVRAGTMTSHQLMALCAAPTHERQREIWGNAKSEHAKEPNVLRTAALNMGEINAAEDPRVAFIGGAQAYADAGGEVRRDLFSADEENSGFLTDPVLLDRLVGEKLEAMATQYRADGWAWVEVWPKWDHQASYRMGDAKQDESGLPKADKAKLKQLRAQIADLEEKIEKAEEAGEYFQPELRSQLEALEEQVEAITKTSACYSKAVRATAGVIVGLESGEPRIELGQVKPADRKEAAAASGGEISGGRETEPAGRDADTIPESLHHSLHAYRNLAAQRAMTGYAHTAMILLAHWAVTTIGAEHDGQAPTDLMLSNNSAGARKGSEFADPAGKQAQEDFDNELLELISGLPNQGEELWDALAAKSTPELAEIAALGVAMSVSLAIDTPQDRDPMNQRLLGALGLDMADHFVPTAENYFGKLSKPLILKALAESGKDAGDPAVLEKMKKGELATLAEKHMKGTGWLPELLRGPEKPKPDPAKKPKSKK